MYIFLAFLAVPPLHPQPSARKKSLNPCVLILQIFDQGGHRLWIKRRFEKKPDACAAGPGKNACDDEACEEPPGLFPFTGEAS